MKNFSIYQRLSSYIYKYWILFIVVIACSALYSAIDATITWSIKPLLDKGFVAKDIAFIDYIPIFVIGIFIIRGLLSGIGSYGMDFISRVVITRLRYEMLVHIQKLPAKYYDKVSSGKILSNLIYNAEQVAYASAESLTSALRSGGLIIGLLIVMFTISWQLSLLYLLVLPVIAVLIKFSNLKILKIRLSAQNYFGEITCASEENIKGYREIRIFNAQKFQENKFNNLLNKHRQKEMLTTLIRVSTNATAQMLLAMMVAIAIYFATSSVSNSLSVGGFGALLVSMITILKPIKDIVSINSNIQRGVAGLTEIFKLLDSPVESDTGDIKLDKVTGHIKFSDVNFSYIKNKPVLKDINLTINPGSMVALVGQSGSGKSTCISLLLGFYQNYTGSILLDNIDIKKCKLSTVRKQFAVVSQNVTLFNDTIFNNIAYGRKNYDKCRSRVIECAELAYALDFINDLPHGIDTVIGENGLLLSGGQRQRIAIARALFKDAPILILDEATASLDTESEQKIQLALDNLAKRKTILVIAHRLATIKRASTIVVLNKGEIVETGNHAQLLIKNNYYTNLHNIQFNNPSNKKSKTKSNN